MRNLRPICWLVLSLSLFVSLGADSAMAEGCGPHCTWPCCDPFHFFWKHHMKPHGRTMTGPFCGTECSCPPQGPFFGYYPTCWRRWPEGWQHCEVTNWEAGVTPNVPYGMPSHSPGGTPLPYDAPIQQEPLHEAPAAPAIPLEEVPRKSSSLERPYAEQVAQRQVPTPLPAVERRVERKLVERPLVERQTPDYLKVDVDQQPTAQQEETPQLPTMAAPAAAPARTRSSVVVAPRATRPATAKATMNSPVKRTAKPVAGPTLADPAVDKAAAVEPAAPTKGVTRRPIERPASNVIRTSAAEAQEVRRLPPTPRAASLPVIMRSKRSVAASQQAAEPSLPQPARSIAKPSAVKPIPTPVEAAKPVVESLPPVVGDEDEAAAARTNPVRAGVDATEIGGSNPLR